MTKEEIKKEWDERSDYIRKTKNVNADEIYKFFMDKLDQETERLKAELNELKEKHKRDVDLFLNKLSIIKEWLEPNPVIDLGSAKRAIELAEQYYKQNFESND